MKTVVETLDEFNEAEPAVQVTTGLLGRGAADDGGRRDRSGASFLGDSHVAALARPGA